MTVSRASLPHPADAASFAAVALGALDELVAERGGHVREGQRRMASAVADAIAAARHLVVEAGTGTGKSFAYLVPAVLATTAAPVAGRRPRMIVATATKALQEQLSGKDLPVIVAFFAARGVTVRTAMLKGRGNYLCRVRLADAREQGAALFATSGPDPDELAALTDAADDPAWDGDRAALTEAVSDETWRAASTAPGECPGAANCPFAATCFAEAARRRAADADIVVVNTALYGAHLASDGELLGDHDVVIVDEAHLFEDVVADAFGVSLTPGRLKLAARRYGNCVTDPDTVTALRAAADALTGAVRPLDGQRLDRPLPHPVATALRAGQAALTRAGIRLEALRGAGGLAAATTAQTVSLIGRLTGEVEALLTDGDDQTAVTWVEGATIRRALVDVDEVLATRMLPHATVIATSATLTVDGSFEQMLRRWGMRRPVRASDTLPAVGTVTAASPFDYRRQGILYIASRLPDPRQDTWRDAMHAELAELAAAAGGRTLALFTSRAGMLAAADALSGAGLRLLVQDTLPRSALLGEFTAAPGSVLLATASFWTGVDIPGPALSLVTIDKLPFPRRGEPLADARRDAVARRGGNPFAEIDLPAAARTLAQGAGRLIRSTSDRGVVAVFDPRLAQARYGATLRAGLPDFYPMRRLDDVAGALRRLTANLDTA